MPEFLDVEEEQLTTAKTSLSLSDFNIWFDKSAVKARFKKACMSSQGLRCCYCQKFFDLPYNSIWDLEHVLSENDYPQFFAAPKNLAVACKRCNSIKKQQDVLRADYERPPSELPMAEEDYTIPHPHFTAWQEHLGHINFMVYRPKSELGENLINVCKLNGPVLEGAGLTVEMVETAIAAKFFEVLGPVIGHDLPASDAIDLGCEISEAQENLRRDAQLIKLNAALARLEKAERNRAAKAAVTEAA